MGFKHGGYIGKILRINLTDRVVAQEPLREDWARDFLGGVGYSARLWYDEVPGQIDALGPENKMVFMTGPVNGTMIPAASRASVCAKSPMTGSFFHSIFGGYFGPELKFAGYDGLVVEGRADRPVYLWIDDGKVEIRDAGHLWGKNPFKAQEIIRREIGDDQIHIATIGRAGEEGTPYAMILLDIRAAGRGGLGAVMGSKNLKAIAVRGTGSVTVPNLLRVFNTSLRLNELVSGNAAVQGLTQYGTPRNTASMNKAGILPTRNWQTEVFDGVEGITGETMKEKVVKGHRACFACSINCTKYSVVPSGPYKSIINGPDYETVYGFGSICCVDSIEALCKADEICDEYGIDLINAAMAVAWAMECFEKGVFTLDDTEGIDLRFGNADAMLAMTEKIGKREGLGALLAKGTREAARIVGKGSERWTIENKGLDWPGHTCRPFPATAVGYATGPRGGSHHDIRPTAEKSGLVDRKTLEGKGALAAEVNHWLIFCDSALLCHLGEPLWGPLRISENAYEAVNAATGWNLTYEDARRIAERQWNMIRCCSAREGFTRNDDRLPVRFMEEPVPDGPMKGSVITRETLERLKDDYYTYRGWDLKTGNPTPEKLTELGLEFAIPDLYGKA
ncbi:MAG: aldehyde ferredoxin oxidoreductase family protein [Deltaproteobacteria bacterium]|nr:aldehyde ferredoxin oxidoreductase family protein [Deltaproteobacteria bacterium]